MSIGTLSVDLVAKTVKFQQDLERSRKSVEKMSKSMDGMKSLVAAAGAAFASLKIGQAIKGIIDYGDSLQKASIQLGVSTEALSEFNFVAGLADISNEELTKGWKNQNQVIGDAARGIGAGRDALKQLNLSASDLINMKLEDQFLIIGDAINKLTNENQQLNIAADIWGSRQTKLLQITKDGSESINEMRNVAKGLGLTITNDTANSFALFNDTLTILGSVFKGLGLLAIEGFIEPFIRGTASMIEGAGKFINVLHGMRLESVTKKITDMSIAQAELHAQIKLFDEEINKQTTNIGILLSIEEEAGMSIGKMRDKYDELTKQLEKVQAEETRLNNVIKDTASYSNSLIAVADKLRSQLDKVGESSKKIGTISSEAKKATEDLSTMARAFDLVIAQFEKVENQEAVKFAGLEDIEKLIKPLKDDASEIDKLFKSVGENISSGIGDAFASAIVYGDNFAKSMTELGKAIKTQVISALVQMGVQTAINYAASLLFKKKEVTQAAVTGPAIAAAYAPAAAATSIATLGGAAVAGAAALIATFALSKSLAGQAHDGLDNAPRTGTFLIEKGEAVIKSGQNKRFEKIANNMEGRQKNVNVTFQIQSIDTQSGVQFIKRNENYFRRMMTNAANSRFVST